jgi:hypothetical protein
MIIGGSTIKSLLIARGSDILINGHEVRNEYRG